MPKKEVINTEKFLAWLEKRIIEEYKVEMQANREGSYATAAEAKNGRDIYEFIRDCIDGKYPEEHEAFMEEVDG